MATPKLTLVPLQGPGFSLGDPGGVLSAKLDGGLSRYRRDVIGGARTVSVQWLLTPAEFDYFQDFYEDAIDEGALPFFVTLILNGSRVQECLAHIVPGSLKIGADAPDFPVAADLEVIPGAQSSKPMPPTILAVPSPVTSDEIPVSGTCDWTTESVTLLLNGVPYATVAPVLGRVWTVPLPLGGRPDGDYTLTATATNAAGTSAPCAPVSFYSGNAAAAASFTLDGMELFDDT